MTPNLARETDGLRRSWEQHSAAFLDGYLVAGVEDPRINVQSVLSRHFLLGGLFGDRFQDLRQAELEFAAAMNWLLSLEGELATPEGRAAVRYGLERDVENVEGLGIPAFMRALWRRLGAGDGAISASYLTLALEEAGAGLLAGMAAQSMLTQWRGVLATEVPLAVPPRVLELACGSANDFRAIAACGLDRFIHYLGLDLSPKNIANAKARFPGVDFLEGNALALDMPDAAVEWSFAHDLLEHLSPDALPQAVAEVCRVTGRAICLGCFSATEAPEHRVRPTADYHWNTLSVERLSQAFAEGGFDATVIHIGTFLRSLLGDAVTHNPDAYTLVMERR